MQSRILLLVVLVVELLLDYYAIECLLTNLHLELCAELAISSVHQCHCHALIDRDTVVTSGNLAYLLAFSIEHSISMTRHSLVLEFDTHDLLSHAVSLLLHESVLTDGAEILYIVAMDRMKLM